MTDYSSTFTEVDGVDSVDAADFSTEFTAIETAVATKYDSTTGNLQMTGILDTNGNEAIKITATGSAVNELTVANAATGNKPAITVSGEDVGVDIEGVEIHNGTVTGALTGNADTVTTNANLTGDVTSVGNATTITPNIVTTTELNTAPGTETTENVGTLATVTFPSNGWYLVSDDTGSTGDVEFQAYLNGGWLKVQDIYATASGCNWIFFHSGYTRVYNTHVSTRTVRYRKMAG